MTQTQPTRAAVTNAATPAFIDATDILKTAANGIDIAYRKSEHFYKDMNKTPRTDHDYWREALYTVISRAAKNMAINDHVNVLVAFDEHTKKYPDLMFQLALLVNAVGTKNSFTNPLEAYFLATPVLGVWRRTSYKCIHRRAGEEADQV